MTVDLFLTKSKLKSMQITLVENVKSTLRLIAVGFLVIHAEKLSADEFETGLEAYKEKNYAQAFAILNHPDQGENPEVQYALGQMYLKGQGTDQDDTKARTFFEKAAEQGHPKAQFMLGVIWYQGWGVKPDPHKVLHWYHKAAEQGVTDAQFNLAQMYRKGFGVHKNFETAAHWYRKAAELGDAGAQNHLGVMYSRGEGVPKDNRQAVEWFRKSAEGWSLSGQYHLGINLEIGLGEPSDLVQADAWLSIAASRGHRKAIVVRQEIHAKMTAEQRNKGRELADHLITRYMGTDRQQAGTTP